MADNKTSDQSGKGKDTGVHPPVSEELPDGAHFHEGQNVPAISSDPTDNEANALMAHGDASVSVTGTEASAPLTHSDANKVSNSENKFYKSLPDNDSRAVTPEIKMQERKQEDLNSGDEHSDAHFKNESPSHDSIQSSDTAVIPDDRREMDDHDSKWSHDIVGTPGDSHKEKDEDLTESSDVAGTPGDRHKEKDEDLTGSSDVVVTPGDSHKEKDEDLTGSSDVVGTPGDSHKEKDEDLTGSSDVVGTPGDSHKEEDEDLTGSSDVAGTPGDSHKEEDEDLTGSSDVAGTPEDSHKEDNDLTQSSNVTGFSEYSGRFKWESSDHPLPDGPATQFSPERVGANQTPASPSISVVDSLAPPVVTSTPANIFRTQSTRYESESGISQRESGIWFSQNESSMRYYYNEPSLGYSPSESGIEMSFNDQMSQNSEKKKVLEEKLQTMENRVQKIQKENKFLQEKHVMEQTLLEEKLNDMEKKLHEQETENKNLKEKHVVEQKLLEEKLNDMVKKLHERETENKHLKEKHVMEQKLLEEKLNDMVKKMHERETENKNLKEKHAVEQKLLVEKLNDMVKKMHERETENKNLKEKHVMEQKLLEEKLNDMEKKMNEQETENKNLKDVDVKNWELQKHIEERDSNIKLLQDNIEDLKEGHKKQIQSLQEELNKSRKHPDSNEPSKGIADQIKELQKQISDKESLYQGARNEVKRLQNKHAQELETLKRQLDEAKQRTIEEMMRSSTEKHVEAVGSLQKELNESKQRVVELQRKIVHLQAKEKEYNVLKNKHDVCEKNFQTLKKEMARLQDDHVTKTDALRESLMKQHQEELQHLHDTMAKCEEDLASNKLILNNALLRELHEKKEKDENQLIIEEKYAEAVKILQEKDDLQAALQSCLTKAISSRTRCLLWKCVAYLRTLQLKNLENVHEEIVSESEEQKRLNTTVQRALAECQEELDEVKSTLQEERDAVSELQQEKAMQEEENAVLQDRIQQTKDQVSDRDQQIEKLKTERKQLEKLKAKSDEQVIQVGVMNKTLQTQVVKLRQEREREGALKDSKISELTAQIRQREQQLLPLTHELSSAHSRLEEVQNRADSLQACNHTLQEELHKATAALTERGRQEEALQSKIQDLSLKNSRYLQELSIARRDLTVMTERLRRTEVWMR